MSVNFEALGARVTIARESDGTSRVFALEQGIDGNYVSVAQSPDEGFPPPLAIGPPEQRTDLRTRQQILRDWRRGMGEDEYDETQGTMSFRYSQCDTRFRNVLVSRALWTRLGSATTVANTLGARIAYVGTGTAKWFQYGTTATAKYYSTATSQWVATTLANGSTFYTRGAGGLYLIHDSLTSISYSTDAITWSAVSVAGINALFGVVEVRGLAIHDAKLFTLAYNNAGGYALMQSANPTSGAATWTQLGTLTLDPAEQIRQLFVWKFPAQPERGGLFCLTNHNIWWYDDTADAASVTAWKLWHKWDLPYPTYFGYGHATVHGATGDLYVMPHIDQDKLWQFTGSTITPHGPNERGGLPRARQGSIVWSAANGQVLVAWVSAGNSIGVGGTGMVAVLNEQEGWHHVWDDLGTAQTVIGGGLGPTSAVIILDSGIAIELPLPDSSELPQYATAARSYDPSALNHDTAKMDLGSPGIRKVALYHEMNAKIPSGASVQVLYRLDDSDQTGAFTSLGTATTATAMPWRAGFPANTTFRQAELRYTLTRGTATSATPIVTAGILHTTLLPPARFNTAFSITLRPERYGMTQTEAGYGLTGLRDWLLATHGQIVSYTVSHPGEALTLARGQMVVSPTLDPVTALGRVTVQVRDLTTPSSG